MTAQPADPRAAGQSRPRRRHVVLSRANVRAGSVLAGLALLLLTGALGGCGTYATESAKIKTELGSGDVAGALAVVGEVDDEDVLGLLQRGLLLFYAGENVEAAQTFDRAYRRIDFLYGTDYVKEAISFLTNDAQRDYTGYPAEQILLHTYASLAYLAEGDLEKALVEARRANQRLSVLAEIRVDEEGYGDDAFAEWIAAMLHAEGGDANACMVSARRALKAFHEYAELWGQPIPSEFVRDHTVWARRFGFPEEALALEEEFGDIARLARPPRRDEGEVVLVYESGWVDHLEEARLDWPIFVGDDDVDEDERARRIYRRGHRGRYRADDDVEIAYWLSVAIPVLQPTEPQWTHARLKALDLTALTEPVHPVSEIFALTFHEGETTRMVRTIARAFTKYQLVRAAREGGKDDGKREVAGFLANIFTSATERADTRSWSTLPDRIHVARLTLPEGVHEISVDVLDRNGSVVQTAIFEEVRVVGGQRTLLHHRTYR